MTKLEELKSARDAELGVSITLEQMSTFDYHLIFPSGRFEKLTLDPDIAEHIVLRNKYIYIPLKG